MLDKNFIRENLQHVRERLSSRGAAYPLDELVAADDEWRQVLLRSEELRRLRNEASAQIGGMKKQGLDTVASQARVKEISAEIKSLEEKVRANSESSARNRTHRIG